MFDSTEDHGTNERYFKKVRKYSQHNIKQMKANKKALCGMDLACTCSLGAGGQAPLRKWGAHLLRQGGGADPYASKLAIT